ncbi:ImmA/IrrE family metallo-endopeptidase [Brucella pseudintermedia]|uniref:ImmA/IrrE family metallo-endopeptidase n=1 Tax=Brucella pseudintermedia TaxID=370111 RepID=UPI0036717584|nr:ImmA/IrrE family metallo-endopeptidase [Brucella pseudintermedia]
MSSQNYVVPAVSWDDIGAICDDIRIRFSLADKAEFPVMDFLETILFQKTGIVDLLIGDEEEMGPYEGFTDPKGEFIKLRQDVYENAWNGVGRDRFTVAHELGHFFLHTDIPMARAAPSDNIAVFRLSEPQANQFAAELLMPRKFMLIDDTPSIVAERHGVSIGAATNRIRYMNKLRSKRKGSDM